MAGYDCLPMKMKRKDFDRVNDDFSDFSLSSPARKIRRLDLDLPPIMEEEEIQSAPRNSYLQDLDLPTILEEEEEIQSAPLNEERAIVLFKPPQHHYQPQVFVDRNLVSGFKNRYLHNAALDDDLYDDDEKTNKNQALVCWNPTQFQFLESTGTIRERREPEIVELDGEDTMMEDAAMDVEEGNSGSVSQPQPQQLVGGSYQWQHCMVPELPQTKSTPISWFR
ncbi:hypothetical protein AALP_AA3G305700 [Arabis alpina]|uniref:Uncharacterized protein n=1 Tax=Arabis alpina TaxID=50452 RepID=A0A087HCR4_ARAAL|nr:hypothetical protein AALP_AA3G305700 [Arabis alpina]